MAEQKHHWSRLLEWYAAYRDDEWEHHHGIKLVPLEHQPGEHQPGEHKPGEYKPGEYKPGWSLIIDTGGTELADITMAEQRLVRSETDWLQWSFEPASFRAIGGERNVPDMIDKLFDEIERVAAVYKRD